MFGCFIVICSKHINFKVNTTWKLTPASRQVFFLAQKKLISFTKPMSFYTNTNSHLSPNGYGRYIAPIAYAVIVIQIHSAVFPHGASARLW